MSEPGRLVAYANLAAMTEGVHTDRVGSQVERWDLPAWGSEEEVALIRRTLTPLEPLDDDVRKIRAHVASFTGCDSGVPATIDELLEGIGRGALTEPAFRNGCDHPGFCISIKSTQPRQIECTTAIHEILTARLAGKPNDALIQAHPWATGFIDHVYTWLPPTDQQTELQTLLVERMLLPFEFLTRASHADPPLEQPCIVELRDAAMKQCYQDGGRGQQIDGEIERLAGLPKISMALPRQARMAEIDDPTKLDLYTLCCCLAHGLHWLSDCHHSTFRWIENWIYAVGTGRWGIPERQLGAESDRLSHLMFGYLLGLDKWLLDMPEQFLLLDLGHTALGFDPKNEILRVYAYLGSEHTPVKTWLAAYLWTNLMYNTGGLLWRNKHRALVDQTEAEGVSVREWMDAQIG